MEKADVIIIGAGVVGLSIARSVANGKRTVVLLEQHSHFGEETSSRNSEVIHAGIYYTQNFIKGRLCVEGNDMMYELCHKHRIPHANTSKLIICVNESEDEQLPSLFERAKNNRARDVRMLSKDEVKHIEPNIFAISGLLCPSSGIVDSHSLMRFFEADAIDRGANVVYNSKVVSLEKNGNSGFIVTAQHLDGSESSLASSIVINSAGLHADKVAAMLGIDIDKFDYRIKYRKGIYYRVSGDLRQFPKRLIYPFPPDIASVGIHTTPDLAGGMRLGPHFFWVDAIDYKFDYSFADMFFEAAKGYLPFLERENLHEDTVGVHPELHSPGETMKDYVIREESDKGLPGLINLVGIGSPGLTASPAIGKYVAEMVGNML
jgi:L-2-hydroxyglutarate oxidase LhgO